jgi:ferredoxin-type protein NapH
MMQQQIQQKKTKYSRITLIRRTCQVFFFLLIVYGGFLYLHQVDTDALPFVQTNPAIKKLNVLAAPQGYTEVLDTYMPFRTCRYLDGNRIFRACSVHFLTEVPAYGVPLYDFLPHLFVILILSFIFGRFLCGWVCPLGFISEMLSILRKWLRLEHLTLPQKFYDVIKKLRLVWIAILFILAVAIAVPFIGLAAFRNELFLIACQTCPARNVFPLISGHIPNGFDFSTPILFVMGVLGIIFLVMLGLGFFGKRIWCMFCPNGIILSWFNKGCLVTKEKDDKKCTKCGICKRVCPMNNEEVYNEKTKKNVSSQNCINCFTCVEHCPEEKCLTAKFAGITLFESRIDNKLYKDEKTRKQREK